MFPSMLITFRLHLPRTLNLSLPLHQRVMTTRLICAWQIRRVWQPVLLLVPTGRAEGAGRARACRAVVYPNSTEGVKLAVTARLAVFV